MQEVDLPRHVIETFEEKWARKLQQQAPAWRSAMSPARSRTTPAYRSRVDHVARALPPASAPEK